MKKKTHILRTSLTYKQLPQDIETPKGESETIPGEAYSLQDLIVRAMGGIPVEQSTPHYSNTEDFDDVDPASLPDFDLVDAENIIQQSTDVITAANKLLTEAATQPKPKTKVEPEAEEAEPEERSESTEATSD